MTNPRRSFLFVCGVARSGTTALAKLLNRHPAIAIGIERYKMLSSGQGGGEPLSPSLFEKERFFDFRESDTNVKDPGEYKLLLRKFDRARYVGDKVPRLYRKVPYLFENFPKVRVIFISRSALPVAASWTRRAQNDEDKWPSHNDYARAVEEWNAALKIALRAKERYGDSFLIVRYEDIFAPQVDAAARLIRKLELNIPLGFEKTHQTLLGKAPPRDEILTDEARGLVLNAADNDTFDKLNALAI